MSASTLLHLGLFAIVIISFAHCEPQNEALMQEWKQFKEKYGKNYPSADEEARRMSIYIQHKKVIDSHNSLAANGLKSYTMGINEYSDLSPDEFIRSLTGYIHPPGEDVNATLATDFSSVNLTGLPSHVNWRDRGCVTHVKNQGRCGSCWAFSAAGAIEGCHARKSGWLVPLSEQQLIDCSARYGNKGCSGGWMSTAYRYVKDQGGIDHEGSYPYEGRQGPCRYSDRKIGARVSGWVDLPRGSEGHLTEAIARVGPIAVAMNYQHSFQHYRSGVYFERGCNPNELNHAILAVGYGPDYYLAKNSWGTSWGEGGYIKMARNRGNNCGIASGASYPIE